MEGTKGKIWRWRRETDGGYIIEEEAGTPGESLSPHLSLTCNPFPLPSPSPFLHLHLSFLSSNPSTFEIKFNMKEHKV